jgi:nicotinamide mononucleotide (NMN) deamidase PncC
MGALELRNLVERIHASGRQFVLALTGGGSGAISALLRVSGASAAVLEIIVPYSSKALDDWLGGPVDQYCSESTARAMAMRAFERARALSSAEPRLLCGIGVTASLATNRPKRGAHRIYVAWQSASTTAAVTCRFTSGDCTRDAEESVATQLILYAVAESCRVPAPLPVETSLGFELARREHVADESWTELLLGRRTSVLIAEHSAPPAPPVLFPGAFNPPHWGHELMAQIASQRYGKPVTFELSITNVDKRPLDYIEISDRLQRLAGRPVLLTCAPTFVEKSQIAPGCVFVVGADTIRRIADPVYYNGDKNQRDEAVSAIADRGCRFLVFGRTMDGTFASLPAMQIPPPLRDMCDEVPESEFNSNVSSTELRAKQLE